MINDFWINYRISRKKKKKLALIFPDSSRFFIENFVILNKIHLIFHFFQISAIILIFSNSPLQKVFIFCPFRLFEIHVLIFYFAHKFYFPSRFNSLFSWPLDNVFVSIKYSIPFAKLRRKHRISLLQFFFFPFSFFFLFTFNTWETADKTVDTRSKLPSLRLQAKRENLHPPINYLDDFHVSSNVPW